MSRLIKLCFMVIFVSSLFITGCGGPDTMTIGYNQAEYKADSDAYRGFGVGFTWKLK